MVDINFYENKSKGLNFMRFIFCFLTEGAVFVKKKFRDICVIVLRIVLNVEKCDFASSLRKPCCHEHFFEILVSEY